MNHSNFHLFERFFMSNQVQIVLQDEHGSVYDIDVTEDIESVPMSVIKKNIELIASESNLRWKIDGEGEEFDHTDKYEEIKPLLDELIKKCFKLEISAYVVIPVSHTYGGMYTVSARTSITELTPRHVFAAISEAIGN